MDWISACERARLKISTSSTSPFRCAPSSAYEPIRRFAECESKKAGDDGRARVSWSTPLTYMEKSVEVLTTATWYQTSVVTAVVLKIVWDELPQRFPSRPPRQNQR